MPATVAKKKEAVRSRPRSRAAEELMKNYRQLGFVYSGVPVHRRANDDGYGLDRMDPRPRVDLTFSALSVQ